MNTGENIVPEELLKNAREHDKENSFDREPIQNTPFVIITEPEIGSYIVMGEYRLTHPTKTKEEQIKLIENVDWLFLTVVISAMVEINVKAMKIKEKEEITTE